MARKFIQQSFGDSNIVFNIPNFILKDKKNNIRRIHKTIEGNR